MASISFVGEAGAHILARINAGTLEVVGLQVRDVVGKKIRYIVRGAEHLPSDPVQLGNMPPLEPLRAAMSVAQLANLVGVAQNAMLARTLGRIEGKLDQMGRNLTVALRRLGSVEAKTDFLVQLEKAKPMNLLRSAQDMATMARAAGDTGQLLAAAMNAQHAALDLLSCARGVAETRCDGVPLPFMVPHELATLVDAAAEAMAITAAMQLALGHSSVAARNLRQVATAIRTMRADLADRITDPALAECRVRVALASDAAVLEAAAILRHTQRWVQSRAACIAAGLIGPGQGEELEAVAPVIGLTFEAVEIENV